jgi:hypothetical protein
MVAWRFLIMPQRLSVADQVVAVTPATLLLATTGLLMLHYNRAVTGDPFQMPYQLHETQYGRVPIFWFQPLNNGIHYRHEAMRRFYDGWAAAQYLAMRNGANMVVHSILRVIMFMGFFLGFQLALLLPPIRRFWKGHSSRLALIVCGLLMAATYCVSWYYPTYSAAAFSLVYLLLISGIRHLSVHYRCGGQLQTAAVLTASAVSIAMVVSAIRNVPESQEQWQYRRAAILQELTNLEGKHLVVVHYTKNHNPHDEWVYNRADIDNAKVVWAREMDPGENRKLFKYFRHHYKWILDADHEPPRLRPLTVAPGIIGHQRRRNHD